MCQGSSPGPASLGPSVPSPVRDSPLLVEQVKEMRLAMETLQQNVSHVKANDLRDRVARLKPLHLPAKTVKEVKKIFKLPLPLNNLS